MDEYTQKLFMAIIETPREQNSDEKIRFSVERALAYRKLYLGLGAPDELYNSLLQFITNDCINYLKSTDYKNFLRSCEWEIVRNYKIFLADYSCEECGSTERLEVHHKTYQFKGKEAFHLNTLQVLCRDCHQSKHPEK